MSEPVIPSPVVSPPREFKATDVPEPSREFLEYQRELWAIGEHGPSRCRCDSHRT